MVGAWAALVAKVMGIPALELAGKAWLFLVIKSIDYIDN
jgi:hypothetical protein